MNKHILGAVFGATMIAGAPARAAAQPVAVVPGDQAAKLAEARAIIAVVFPADGREQTFANLQQAIVNQLSATLPAIFKTDPGLRAIFDQFKDDALKQQRVVLMKHLPLQMEAMADAYTRRFSMAELKDIHAFALTPAGGHYLSESLKIATDPEVSKATGDAMAEIQAVTQALLPAFQEKAMAYVKAHPEVAEKIEAQSGK